MDPECEFCANTKLQTGFGTFGGQIGYNWQISNFVLGIEGDLNWASAKKTDVFHIFNEGNSVTLKMDAFGSIRARAGLAVDRTLIYVTGGPAWGHFDSSLSEGFVLNRFTATDKEWRTGLAAGAGVEFMLTNNWILRGEYLFLNFLDSSSPLFRDGVIDECGDNDEPCRIKFANTANLVRAGLSYKF